MAAPRRLIPISHPLVTVCPVCLPQRIQLTSEKIIIRTYGLFWLSHTDEEIPWAKIAGHHYHSGWFWDRLEIQTRGQAANHIGGLPKAAGTHIRGVLDRMKE